MTKIYDKEEDLPEILKGKTLIAIGPGLGKSNWSRELFDFFMNSDLPKIIDADALNLLSESQEKYDLKNAVLTPDPKEAARLLKRTVAKIQQDRKKSVQDLFNKYQAISILKGCNSLIFTGDQKFYLCPYGNPAMAVAGMGDILTGLIAGFATQNISLGESAILATYQHALAADKIKSKKGEIGLLPMDILTNYY